jgi:hypothetical protein
MRPGAVSEMKSNFGTIVTIEAVLGDWFEIKENNWSYSYNWINYKIESEEKKYKLTGNFTLKDVFDALPCEDALQNFISELSEDYHFQYIVCKPESIKLTDEILEYKTFKNNIDWAIEKRFVEEVKEVPELKIGQKWRHISTGSTWRIIQGMEKLEFLNTEDYTTCGDVGCWEEFCDEYELIED